MNQSLKGKHAVVCGASQGIGRATALKLAAMGASLTVIARDEEALAEVVSECERSQGQQHRLLSADMSKLDLFRAQVEDYIKEHGPVHICVHNSGGPEPGDITKASPKEFLSAFTQHVLAAQVLSQAALMGMRREQYGRIVCIISSSVKNIIKGLGVSNTTRGAMASWSKSWSQEVGRFGITVNNVLPGATNTDRLKRLRTLWAEEKGMPLEEYIQDIQRGTPLGRAADPEEVANAVAFLASPEASFISGTNIVVDGGRMGCL